MHIMTSPLPIPCLPNDSFVLDVGWVAWSNPSHPTLFLSITNLVKTGVQRTDSGSRHNDNKACSHPILRCEIINYCLGKIVCYVPFVKREDRFTTPLFGKGRLRGLFRGSVDEGIPEEFALP